MDKSQNNNPNQKSDSMPKEKTNQDFNGQKPGEHTFDTSSNPEDSRGLNSEHLEEEVPLNKEDQLNSLSNEDNNKQTFHQENGKKDNNAVAEELELKLETHHHNFNTASAVNPNRINEMREQKFDSMRSAYQTKNNDSESAEF